MREINVGDICRNTIKVVLVISSVIALLLGKKEEAEILSSFALFSVIFL